MVQCVSVQAVGRHHRDPVFGQFAGEGVFFADRRIAPARGAIELGHAWRSVLDADAEYPVFVAVQRQHAAVATQAQGFDGLYHPLRVEAMKWLLTGHRYAQPRSSAIVSAAT